MYFSNFLQAIGLDEIIRHFAKMEFHNRCLEDMIKEEADRCGLAVDKQDKNQPGIDSQKKALIGIRLLTKSQDCCFEVLP